MSVVVVLGACGDGSTTPGAMATDDDDGTSGGETSAESGTSTGASASSSEAGSSTTGIDPGTDATTGSSSSSGDVTGSSSTGSGESDSSGGSSTGEDIDIECEGPVGSSECTTPSPFLGDGECDPYEQNCPAGEKCLPWANDGGTSWNATRCSPLSVDPDQLGDSCFVEGSGVSGVDSCDLGLMCWDADPETNMGVCVAMCGCGPVAPSCVSDGTACAIANDGVLPLCLPTCDPLDQSQCADGQGCYQVGDDFQCAPDASGDDGAPGTACQFINACDPGSACLAADIVPGCFSNVGCCSEYCDVDEANGCANPQTQCIPLFAPGQEPEACHEDTGVCIEP